MDQQILLHTTDIDFGEMLFNALVKYGGYEVFLTETQDQALQFAQIRAPSVIVWDFAGENPAPAKFMDELLKRQPGIRLVVLLPEDSQEGANIAALAPRAVLKKPVHPRELYKTVVRIQQGRTVGLEILADFESHREKTSEDIQSKEQLPDDRFDSLPFPWLKDLDLAAQHLTQLSLESAAKAAMIVHKDQLYAYAGEFTHPGASGLAETVGQHWHRRKGSDLAQFVKLDDGQEYMMYATHLVDELVLALIFDAQMPFSKIRAQANRLAVALSSDRMAENSPPEEDGSRDGSGQPKKEAPDGMQPDRDTHPAGSAVETAGPAVQNLPDMQEIPLGLELKEVPVDDIEAGAAQRPPDPAADWKPAQLAEEPMGQIREEPPGMDIPSDWRPTAGIAEGPGAFLKELIEDPLPPASLPYEDKPEEFALPASSLPDKSKPIPHAYFPNPENMDETRPTSVPKDRIPAVRLPEPENTSFFNATYACVLVPRLPRHHLVRDLAKILEDWMPQICISFDWRMKHLAIRPEYMQWMAQIHSATAPGFHVQIITKITSDKIFYNLPRLADENPSGEFWAPGRLMVTSDKMLHPSLVQEFIQKTRKRQGLV